MEVVHTLVSMSAAPVALLKLIELMSISPIMFDFTLNRYNSVRRDWHGSEVLITRMALVRIDRRDREKRDWSMNSSVRIMLHMYNEVVKTVNCHGSCIGDNFIRQELDINKHWCSLELERLKEESTRIGVKGLAAEEIDDKAISTACWKAIALPM